MARRPAPEPSSLNDRSPAGPVVRGSNQMGMRDHNERLVLTLIRMQGPLAKAPVARMTGLSAQTASVIMRKLEDDGLIGKGEPQRGRVGQPSVPMHLSANGAYFLGVKIGRRSVEAVLTDFLGRVLSRRKRVHLYPDFDDCLAFAAGAARALREEVPAQARDRIAGIGIALPFRLWEWAGPLGVAADAMASWRDNDIAAALASALDLPVFLENDATAACAAEQIFGGRRLPASFLHVYVGYFVGGGLVLDGSVYTGRTGNAAALGSMVVPGPDGPRQLIDLASLAGLERQLVEAGVPADPLWDDTAAWALPSAVLDPWLDTAAAGIAHAIAAATAVVETEAALIDGWLPPAVRARLTERVDRALGRIDLAGISKPAVGEGTLGAEARVLGAASLPLSHRFLVDRGALSGAA